MSFCQQKFVWCNVQPSVVAKESSGLNKLRLFYLENIKQAEYNYLIKNLTDFNMCLIDYTADANTPLSTNPHNERRGGVQDL